MTRIACIGGFLGAGKTTALIRAARVLIGRGVKVGIITNDQGHHLVDTELVRSFGLTAEEIGGGCFCCRFSDFTRTADHLVDNFEAEMILAEAVGSCTDLSATVCQRLRRSFAGQFDVAPLTVIVDPGRVREMLSAIPSFDENVRYLFSKQLAEADHIVVTKADLLDPAEIAGLKGQLQQVVGKIPVSVMSAKTGMGVSEWVDLIRGGQGGVQEIDVDYDRYGAAEAALGWLNATIELSATKPFRATDLGEALIARIREACRESGHAVAHVKILFVTADGSDWIALTDAEGSAAWGGANELRAARDASMIINARVCTGPDLLRELIEGTIQQVATEFAIHARTSHIEAFAPSPPVRPAMTA